MSHRAGRLCGGSRPYAGIASDGLSRWIIVHCGNQTKNLSLADAEALVGELQLAISVVRNQWKREEAAR